MAYPASSTSDASSTPDASVTSTSTSTTILVTGAGGQLGRELQVLAHNYPQFKFVFATKDELPIGDPGRVTSFFQEVRPAFCINCAAYTAVDRAESETATAFLINGTAVGYLAAACRRHGTRLIHISTDYVFDGNSATPLKEQDPTGPINVYGASKLAGEKAALQELPADTLVIRTSWVYSEFGNNFVKTMIRLMKEKPSLNIVNDQIGSPTYAADLAAVILQIVVAPHFVPGIYHYSNEGAISWYDFAVAIKQLTDSPCPLHPIPSSQFPTPARRPHYSLLDKSLISDRYGLTIPAWRPSLMTCITRLTGATT